MSITSDDRDYLFDELSEDAKRKMLEVENRIVTALETAIGAVAAEYRDRPGHPEDASHTAIAIINGAAVVFMKLLKSAVYSEAERRGFIRADRVPTMLARIEAYVLKPPGIRAS